MPGTFGTPIRRTCACAVELIVFRGAHLNGFKTVLPKVMPCMSSRQVERTVPGAVRQTVRRTVCRLIAVSSEDRLKELSAGPCHMVLC